MEDWVTIKTLKAKNPDMSYREIGRLLSISPKTVKRATEKGSPPEYKRVRKLNSQSEPFKEVIYEMVNVKRFSAKG